MSDSGNRDENIAKGCLSTLAFLVFIAILIGSMASSSNSGGGSSSAKSVTWETYDVIIDVQDDGTLHVTEQQDVTFNGSFSQGYANIPLDRVESIDNVRVTTEGQPRDIDGNGYLASEELEYPGPMMEGRQVEGQYRELAPGEFTVIEQQGELRIDYAFESTRGSSGIYASGPQTRTIKLEYDVSGAIRDYPEAAEPWQQVHWMAISSEVTEIAEIRAASVVVNLPESVPVETLAFAPEPDSVTGNRLEWSKRDMGEGDSFDAQVAFPAITAATAPSWQIAADQHDADIEAAENRQSLASLMLIGAGILVVVGGGLALLYAWYTRIHESVPGLVPDILPEPPGDLPAGLVGALVDEQVNPRDIAATIMDLGRRGIVRIKPNEGQDKRVYGGHPRYALELVQPISAALPYEQVMLRAIFREGDETAQTVTFDALRTLFGAFRVDIQTAMDEELVRRGYFAESPEVSRNRWERLLKGFVAGTMVVAIAILLLTRSWTWWVLLPPVLGIALYYIGKRLTPAIARKTREGAETSAKWSAFQRYLESTGNSIFGEEWKSINEKYLPWVIAFGMDYRWLGQMNSPYSTSTRPSLASSGPVWGGGAARHWSDDSWSSRSGNDTWQSGRTSSAGSWSPGWSPSFSGWDSSRWPDMQGGSNSVLGALGDTSNSLFSMMGDAMEAIGSSSGSGGGGSSGGGSSFGGGSSSSSGGRSHSSSGGGSRGFS